MMEHIKWKNCHIEILDQTRLPDKIEYLRCFNYDEVAGAIRDMKVRGAPAIGIVAAMGIALGVKGIENRDYEGFMREFDKMARELHSTRPTAVNLFWAIDRIRRLVIKTEDNFCLPEIKRAVREEADRIMAEDIHANRRIGKYGATLIDAGQRILTHCNAGALATGGYGTALGVIRAAWDEGKGISVLVDETRPLLQGARLTAWELQQEGIPFTLITDNMAGECMRRRMVDVVIVGADRITLGGDVANKIGTYALAVLAREHNIPFYVAAPISTIDFSIDSGEEIEIEERGDEEVTHLNGHRISPIGCSVFNPAFDITPSGFISAIITQNGIIYPPYRDVIESLGGH